MSEDNPYAYTTTTTKTRYVILHTHKAKIVVDMDKVSHFYEETKLKKGVELNTVAIIDGVKIRVTETIDSLIKILES